MSLFSFRRPVLDPRTAARLRAIRQRSRGLSRFHGERSTTVTPRETMAQLVRRAEARS